MVNNERLAIIAQDENIPGADRKALAATLEIEIARWFYAQGFAGARVALESV
jgi:hypothetical protein